MPPLHTSFSDHHRSLPTDSHHVFRRYFVLLVGINDYPASIGKLDGCVHDITKIESFLLQSWLPSRPDKAHRTRINSISSDFTVQSHGPLHILKLLNEQATYRNIIKAFQSFLQQAKTTQTPEGTVVEDVVWFHFSGHGSEQYTAEEFLPLEPNGKDQTMVCFRAEGDEVNQLHLADKETAVLLHQVATLDEQGQAKQAPHIVVSLDCCHAGSGTRDLLMIPNRKSRFATLQGTMSREEAQNKGLIRSLDTYVNGYYEQLVQANRPLEVPLASHVLIAGCESIEEATDLPTGGIFTDGLVHTLKAARGEITYSDLYTRTRRTVQHNPAGYQSPQFESIGAFNPHTRFLDGAALGTPKRYDIIRQKGKWIAKLGAIHGIPLTANQPVRIEIQTLPPESTSMGVVALKDIGAQQSTFTLPDLDPQQTYQAVMHFLPVPPAAIWIHGDASGVGDLKSKWRNTIGVAVVEQEHEADYVIKASSIHYHITDLNRNKEVFSWPRQPDAEKVICDNLEEMANWERMIRLDHPKSGIKDWMEFQIDVMATKRFTISESDTHILATKEKLINQNGNLVAGFNPKWIVKNVDQDLYAYLFHLREDYSIKSYEGAVVYRPSEYDSSPKVVFPMWKQLKGWGIGPDEQKVTSYFKLFVTTEPFDYHQLEQDGLQGMRSIGFIDESPMSVKDDWCCFTYKVSIEKP